MKHHLRVSLVALMLLAFVLTGIPALASGEPSGESLVLAGGETLTVSEDRQLDSLVIGEGCTIQAAEGYSLVMLADGVVTRPAAGSYQNVSLLLQPEDLTYGAFDASGNAEGYAYRFLFNTGDGDVFVADAFDDGVTVSDEDGWTVFNGGGSTLTVNDDHLNAVSAENCDAVIENLRVVVNGVGVCEFGDAFGAALSVAGDDSRVIVRDVDVTTVGAIMSTLNSAAGNVLVMDSSFHGYGTAGDASGLHSGLASYSHVQGSLTEVPWVLGLHGSLRATNVIGTADVLYYNTSASCNGWGVYSTDGGASLIVLNSDAAYDDAQGAAFNSLYGAYILGLPAYLYGYHADLSAADGNTYGIVARAGFTMGASSQANLAALDALITAPAEEEPADDASGEASDEASGEASGEKAGIESAAIVWDMFQDNVGVENVEEQRSSLDAKFGVMSHGASGGVFHITDTDITATDAAFLLKEAYMTIELDGSDSIDAPIVVHQQLTDDASMGEYAYDHCWALATAPFLYAPVDKGTEPTRGSSAVLTDMSVSGDFFNSDTNGAYLDLLFDGAEVSGILSSGIFTHNNASFWLVENPAFDADAAESAENLRYLCVDEAGKLYESCLSYTLFGTINYHPGFEDDDGLVTFLYDASGKSFDPAEIVGYAIFYNDAQLCSDGVVAPCAAINNPVYAAFENGAVWNVTGDSYLAKLDVEPGCIVNGSVTVDGEAVDVSAGGSWAGAIVVSPAAGASAEAEASGEMNLPDGSMPPDPPADLAPGEVPPGGFGGID